MQTYFFDINEAPQVPLYEGQLISYRLVTHNNSGSERLGLHITKSQPHLSGTGTVYLDKDEIIYVLEGSIAVILGGEKRFLRPGEGVFIPARQVYDWEAGPEGWTIATIFSPPADLAKGNIIQEDGSRQQVTPRDEE